MKRQKRFPAAALDRMQSLYGVRTDRALGEKLDVGQSTIAHWRASDSVPLWACEKAARDQCVALDEVTGEQTTGEAAAIAALLKLSPELREAAQAFARAGARRPADRRAARQGRCAMSRHPADQLAASPKPQGRQAIWDVIRQFRFRAHGNEFSVADIRELTDIPTKTIRDYLDCLVAGGYVEVETPSRQDAKENQDLNLASLRLGVSKLYRLSRDTGVEAPRLTKAGAPVTQGAAREQMWRTMKMLGDFSFRDLAVAASLEQSPVAESDAKDYCRNLALAGYLRLVAKGGPQRPARYRFIQQKNTGPLAPMVQRIQSVFDPNLGQIVWHPAVES